MTVRDLLPDLTQSRQLLAQRLQLLIQGVPLFLLLKGRLVLGRELRLQGFQFGLRYHLVRIQRLRHPIIPPGRALPGDAGRVGAHQPMADMVQLLHHLHGLPGLDRFGLVDRDIAHLLDHPGLLKHRLRQQVHKGGFMQQRPQLVVVGHAQAGIVAIQPVHPRLQREAGMEAGGAGVTENMAFRQRGSLTQCLEFVGQEGEVGHGAL